MSFATDTAIVLERELKPVVRDPFSVVFSMVQPLVFLGLFTPLLAGVTGLSTADSLQSFVPGILVMSCLVGTSMTGSNLQAEMLTGAHERLLVSPLDRSAQLAGRALKEFSDWVRTHRHLPTKAMFRQVAWKLRGHFNRDYMDVMLWGGTG